MICSSSRRTQHERTYATHTTFRSTDKTAAAVDGSSRHANHAKIRYKLAAAAAAAANKADGKKK